MILATVSLTEHGSVKILTYANRLVDHQNPLQYAEARSMTIQWQNVLRLRREKNKDNAQPGSSLEIFTSKLYVAKLTFSNKPAISNI